MATSLSFNQVSFTYPNMTYPLLTDVTFDIHNSWCGLVGANGSGKTTLIHLALGDLNPQSGSVNAPLASYCPQETREKPPGINDYLEALYGTDNEAGRIFSLLELDHDWPYRWETLSHGERKRFQLAVALWEDRELLIVDEPTNHLDDSSRRLILSSLKQFEGLGLIVSHDRDFMDNLCTRNLFLKSGGIVLRPGTLTQGQEQEEKERLDLIRQRTQARQEIIKLEKEAQARRKLAESQQKRRSKRGLDIKDHDSRFKKNLARISGKDGTGGKLLRQLDGRMSQAINHMDSLDNTVFTKTGVTQHSQTYKGDRIIFLDEGELPLGENKELIYPELTIKPGERIALRGNNGTGKSSLIERLLTDHKENKKILYIPQEPTDELLKQYWDQMNNLSDENRGILISNYSRLGGDPENLLESPFLSPGEGRKLMLSLGLMETPYLIILDEPTNHLDLGSIQSLETTLSQVDCALLLVSHDIRLREKLTGKSWLLEEHPWGEVILRIEL
jgi:macrolide transport system ATP-binding/permease protein